MFLHLYGPDGDDMLHWGDQVRRHLEQFGYSPEVDEDLELMRRQHPLWFADLQPLLDQASTPRLDQVSTRPRQ